MLMRLRVGPTPYPRITLRATNVVAASVTNSPVLVARAGDSSALSYSVLAGHHGAGRGALVGRRGPAPCWLAFYRGRLSDLSQR